MTKEQWARLEKIYERLVYAEALFDGGISDANDFHGEVAEAHDALGAFLRENQPEEKPE